MMTQPNGTARRFLSDPENWLLVIPIGLVVVLILHWTGVAFR